MGYRNLFYFETPHDCGGGTAFEPSWVREGDGSGLDYYIRVLFECVSEQVVSSRGLSLIHSCVSENEGEMCLSSWKLFSEDIRLIFLLLFPAIINDLTDVKILNTLGGQSIRQANKLRPTEHTSKDMELQP